MAESSQQAQQTTSKAGPIRLRPRPQQRTTQAETHEEPAATSTAKSSTTSSTPPPKDYTSRYRSSGSSSKPRYTGKPLEDKLPDETIHLPPIALFALGGIGVLAGLATNVWQMVTTFVAFWSMFNPGAKPVDFQKQPVLVLICALIAFSFQLALAFLVFRLDRSWKKGKAAGEGSGRAAAGAVVEVVQQTDLVLIWSLLGFVVDTVGDITFINLYTIGLDPYTIIFLIFIYAVALYALSTIGFVRSLEYVWAGFAGVARQLAAATK